MQSNRLTPRLPVPSLEVETLAGVRWRLAGRLPEHLTMIVFYRGFHCPMSKGYLRDLDAALDYLLLRGIDVIAVSSDDYRCAKRSQEEWRLANLPIGYGLTVETARAWGLYISKGTPPGEPARFAEPGLFLVRPDKTLYACHVSSMSLVLPPVKDMLAALEVVRKYNAPARGEA